MEIRLSEGQKHSPHEAWLKAHELYAQLPGPLMWAFKELPTHEEILEERERRLAYPDLLPFMQRFEDLLMEPNITPYWIFDLQRDLLNQWHDGVFKPGISHIQRAGELSKDKLKEWLIMRSYSNFLEDEIEELVKNNSEIREPVFHDLGLDDPEEEGIFNPSKALILERNAYRRSEAARIYMQESMSELEFQGLMNWFHNMKRKNGDDEEDSERDDSWYAQFVKVHGEAPMELWRPPFSLSQSE